MQKKHFIVYVKNSKKSAGKSIQSQARSGAGADHVPYTSNWTNWTLYKDLMFLTDHIQPRQTSSNFQPILKRKKAMASQLSHFSSSQHSSLQCATLTSATYPSICTPPIILKKTQM
ncbi:uncharacterized protein LOC105183439 isoform X3 [Harpegnathos saltator]|uniref:uncharacterized protein LOC112588351 isoform X3 n=1 Tax=Harpegnathos saltator TaxID=610380 RepID=UPI000DBEDB24|nr:uncharacterized protein LOC112588351 isoform X3 [Harpegnathos saltator]XP_025153713.1 uncharacterized protein LOC105183439 isoform X3 [Harpegnathos saltator]